MSNKLDKRETATFEEVLISNIYTQEAIINVLARKGLVTKDEILAEINNLRTIASREQ